MQNATVRGRRAFRQRLSEISRMRFSDTRCWHLMRLVLVPRSQEVLHSDQSEGSHLKGTVPNFIIDPIAKQIGHLIRLSVITL